MQEQILTAIGTAVPSTAKVTETLFVIHEVLPTANHSLQQLQHQITDLDDVMERLRQGFSSPAMQASDLESQTRVIGNHWTAVLKLIERTNSILSEMEISFANVERGGGGTGWLQLMEENVVYYRNEIQLLTKTLHFELALIPLCGDASWTEGCPVNFVAVHDEWSQLKKEVAELSSMSVEMSAKASVKKKAVQGSSLLLEEDEGPIGPPSNSSEDYFRQRQLDTAKQIDAYLDSAADVLSRASSTLYVQAPRASTGNDLEQSDEKKATILQYTQEEPYEDSPPAYQNVTTRPPNPAKFILLLIPRLILTPILLFVHILLFCAVFIHMFFWGLALVFTGFQNFRQRLESLKREVRVANEWCVRKWCELW